MGTRCCSIDACSPTAEKQNRRVLFVVLFINVVGFGIEIVLGLMTGSAALQADALDFLGDAGNYALSLAVLGMALRWRSAAALVKGLSMGAFGLWVVASTTVYAVSGHVPGAGVMGGTGLFALALNAASLALLAQFRRGDANMRSVWICSRNDVLGNIAVIAAALGVFGTATGWPDIVVAGVMAALELWGAGQVIAHALRELRKDREPVPVR